LPLRERLQEQRARNDEIENSSFNVIDAGPALAAQQCVEMPSGQNLKAEAKAGKPLNEVVLVLLREAIPPMAYAIDASVHVQGSQGVIVGNNNVQNVTLILERLNNFIDSAVASTQEKEKAKGLLSAALENPLVLLAASGG
jgi:hypothetical protein